MKLLQSFFQRSTKTVARQLIGKYLIRKHEEGDIVGRVVETEAYLGPHDLACHAAKGRTARTEVMFGPGGHAYVYFIYGFYNMLNIVTEKDGYPAAVLIRAVEPVAGIELMQAGRKSTNHRNLTSGPGKLCQAFGIDRSFNGVDLSDDLLYVEDRGGPHPKIVTAARIGVDYAGKWKDEPLRYLIPGNEFVSKR